MPRPRLSHDFHNRTLQVVLSPFAHKDVWLVTAQPLLSRGIMMRSASGSDVSTHCVMASRAASLSRSRLLKSRTWLVRSG